MERNRPKDVLRKERGVSPVIGAILMTAIAVILSATIGSFVLGLGSKVTGTSAPQVNFDFEPIDADNDGQVESVKITHNGGDTVKGGSLVVRGDINDPSIWNGQDVSTGDSVTYNNGPYNGDTIRIVWLNPSGDTSATLAEYTVPS